MKTQVFLLLLLLSFLYIHFVTKKGQYEININDIKLLVTNPDKSDKAALLLSLVIVIFLIFIYNLFNICPSNTFLINKVKTKDKEESEEEVKTKDKEQVKTKDNFEFKDIKCCRKGLHGKPYNFEYTPETDDHGFNQRTS